ncbi:unnamed protein product [Euphydryas editha]|uniref:Gustatory receptor n=1 Tax=Euphydryas editha TaxID=104508 RepID=A0AAU9U7Y6_EUPED|nr:unnamed protein product [Euphydryas editha]
MSPPVPRINTFINVTGKPKVDKISKFFILGEFLIGVNRLHIIGIRKFCFLFMTLCICVSISTSLIFKYAFTENDRFTHQYFMLEIFRFLMCSTLALIFQGKLINFYNELSKFDEDIGFEANKTENRKNIQNYSLMLVAIVLSITLYLFSDLGFLIDLLLFLPGKLQQCFELHYYGHLLILIIPRIKLLTNYISFSYPNKKNNELEEIGNFAKKYHIFNRQIRNFSKIEMKRLINLYNRIIIAFDFLYESTKWQILIFMTTIFTLSLDFSFKIAIRVINNNCSISMYLIAASFFLIEILPFLTPCIYAGQVCSQVRVLKDVISSKLYENILDKSNRSSARSLLSLIETRDLSFSLFHMFEIDIALPFKFMGLLITYLIILLQFDKILN